MTYFSRQTVLTLFTNYCHIVGYSAEEIEKFWSERNVEGSVGHGVYHTDFVNVFHTI